MPKSSSGLCPGLQSVDVDSSGSSLTGLTGARSKHGPQGCPLYRMRAQLREGGKCSLGVCFPAGWHAHHISD